jgi:hypothetical protein
MPHSPAAAELATAQTAAHAESSQHRRRKWKAREQSERSESRMHRSVDEATAHTTLLATNPLLSGAHWSSFAVIANELDVVIEQAATAMIATTATTTGPAITTTSALTGGDPMTVAGAANAHSMIGIECAAVDDNVHRWSVKFTAASFPNDSAIAQQLRQLECVFCR